MNVFEFRFRSLAGATMALEQWSGQPLLIVNTASECGYTRQYAGLQSLWLEYRHTGLIVIGVPCNDFGEQEPGDEDAIATFCSENYGVSFPMTEKYSVIGRDAHPLFLTLREEFTADALPNWNFFKYLFGRDGNLIAHWPSAIEPDDSGFRHEIEKNLSSWSL